MSAAGDAIDDLAAAQKKYDESAQQNAAVMQVQPWSERLVLYLSIEVLVFTALALALAALLLKRTPSTNASHVLRVLGIIAILGFSTLLLVVGYSNEQLTPIVGLFGAIAGYLLGKDTARNEISERRKTDDKTSAAE